MNVSVLGSADADAWAAVLERLPDHDVYHRVEYLRAVEANGDGRAVAFVAEEGDVLLFHAFMQRAIERVGTREVAGGWSDLESAYGYSGPLASRPDARFLASAWHAFSEWCVRERVVAEFVRFSPLLRNEGLVDSDMRVAHDRDTVAVRLDVTDAERWSSYSSVQRNMVRKAQAQGLVAAQKPLAGGLARFRSIYEATMGRVGADAYFLLSDAYYDALLELGDAVRLFEVTSGEEVVAAALFLVQGTRLHYHLSGSDERFRGAAPTNLLLNEAASWGAAAGLHVLHLGGGRTADASDSLLRFKSSLSPLRLPFFTGRRVHDPRMYGDLCSLWLDQARLTARPPYFLLYRLETSP